MVITPLAPSFVGFILRELPVGISPTISLTDISTYFISSDTAYLHHWLSVTVHFNRYNLCFDKYTECGDKCKSVYFIALHICVVPLSFSLFCECPLSDTRCWMIGHFRRYVTEHLLNTKVVVFLEFLWFAVCFLFSRRCWMIESVIKPENFCKVYVWFAWKSVEQCAMGDIRWEKCNKVELFA